MVRIPLIYMASSTWNPELSRMALSFGGTFFSRLGFSSSG